MASTAAFGPGTETSTRSAAERRAALASVARSAEQTLITAAVLEDVPAELRGVRVQVGGGSATVLDEGVFDETVPDDRLGDAG